MRFFKRTRKPAKPAQIDKSAQPHEIFEVFWPHYTLEPRHYCQRTGEFFTKSGGKYTLITRSI